MIDHLHIGLTYVWIRPETAAGLQFKVIDAQRTGVDVSKRYYPGPLIYEIEYLNYRYPKNTRKTVKISHAFIHANSGCFKRVDDSETVREVTVLKRSTFNEV